MSHHNTRTIEPSFHVNTIRVRERGMQRFKSIEQAQRFLDAYNAAYNLFNLGRHLVSVKNYRIFRDDAFGSWNRATALWKIFYLDFTDVKKLTCQYRRMLWHILVRNKPKSNDAEIVQVITYLYVFSDQR